MLPGAKVTAEVAEARGIEIGKDCDSPSSHREFNTPIQMLEFIAKLRELSGGKPTGFKLCIGHRWEFMAICKAMLETGIYPDYIVIDGAEGGTGAAPPEFPAHIGTPLREGLLFARNVLNGTDLKQHVKLAAAGKITTGFRMASNMALGADFCYSARGFMFALGCLQSQSCHTGGCPTGVATQDPWRQRALDVDDKAERVYNFHRHTIDALSNILAAVGVENSQQLRPEHLFHRSYQNGAEDWRKHYSWLEAGELLADGESNLIYRKDWAMSRANSFAAKF
jgi:glutamate synthase domain-containing protein 2